MQCLFLKFINEVGYFMKESIVSMKSGA